MNGHAKPAIRAYRDGDYQACEDLVGRTWEFAEHFRPPGLCAVAQHWYTRSSVVASNFRMVVESGGQVVGFLFGRNNRKPPLHGVLRQLLLHLRMLARLLFVPGVSLGARFALLGALYRHEVNRSRVEQREASELNLFALEPGFQRQGLGRHLVTQFLDDCSGCGVRRVIVEVNIGQASGFYEKCGFVRIGDFVSPLPEVAAGRISLCALYERNLALGPAGRAGSERPSSGC